MPLIFNASIKDWSGRVFGHYHSIKAGQSKNFTDSVSHFLTTERKEFGLIPLPEEFSDPQFWVTEEGKKLLAEKKKQGKEARIAELKRQIYNLEVSLRQDLEQANIKADPKVFASEGDLAAYEELVAYQTHKEDEVDKKVDRLKQLEKQMKAGA